MSAWIFNLSIVLFATTSFAAELPVSGPRENAAAYANLDSAAIAALTECKAQSRRKEWGGCLYQKNGNYYFTEPVTVGSSDRFKARCRMPKDSMVGIYHTHPVGSAEGFSDHDLSVARKLNVTSYVFSVPSSRVIRSSPGRRSNDGEFVTRIR